MYHPIDSGHDVEIAKKLVIIAPLTISFHYLIRLGSMGE